MAIVNEGVGEVDGLRSRRFRRKSSRYGIGEVEGMGKRFRVKVKIKPKAIVKKVVKAQVGIVKKQVNLAKKAASSKIGQMAMRAGAAYVTSGASEAYLAKAKMLKNLVGGSRRVSSDDGGGSNSISTSQAAPQSESFIQNFSPSAIADRVVDSMPDAMTEEVEEVNEKTGRKEKKKKMKPVVKYGMIGGGVGLVGLIAYLLKKKKK